MNAGKKTCQTCAEYNTREEYCATLDRYLGKETWACREWKPRTTWHVIRKETKQKDETNRQDV